MSPARDSIDALRNIALVGPAGSGKTLLLERLLVASGGLGVMGSIEKGSTFSDSDPLEKKYGHSIYPTLARLNHGGRTLRIFDTPGHSDLRGEGLSVLEAVETTALVLDPRAGIHPAAVRMFRYAEDRGLDRLIIVNKIDRAGERLAGFLRDIQNAFGKNCLPVTLPAQRGATVLDCYFQPQGATPDFSSVPEAHKALVEQVIETDDRLMERYLETGKDLRAEDLHEPLEAALRAGHLVPVTFASAQSGVGIDHLLRIFAELLPSPREANPPQYTKGVGDSATPVEASPDASRHVLAHVFRITADRYVGRLAYVRVHQGTVKKGSPLFIGQGKKPFRVAHLFSPHGPKVDEINEAGPGDIFAITKAEELSYDDVLHDDHGDDDVHLRPMRFPQPTYGLAVTSKKAGDEQRLSDVLRKLQAEDRCLVVEHSEATHDLVLRGLGELHLRVVLEEMRERFGVDVDTHTPKIAYRETISTAAPGHNRHKKQTGGAGQFGEVFLRIEPLPRGAGFAFVDEVRGGTIPGQFIPAIEKGVRQVLASGCVAGYPMQDIRCIVYDGKHHSVDSKEVAFVAAGRKAFIEAVQAAAPVLLEPIALLTVNVPDSAVGAVTGELAARRGHISGTEAGADGTMVISATTPLAEIVDLGSRLRGLTGGQGTFSAELSHYDPAPPQVQRELITVFRPSADD